MKRLFLLFFSALLCTAVSAHDFEVDGIYYDITSSTDLAVSVTFRGYEYDSYSNEYSGSVVIPEKVTYESKEYSVTSIDWYAFYGCSGLTSVTIPNSVTSIGGGAFEGCSGLIAVHITDLSAWCKIKFNNFNSNPTRYAHHLYLNGEEIINLVIPEDITSIGERAFYSCSGLTSVTIPSSVTSIGYDAFYNCDGLTAVHITDLSAWCKTGFEDYLSNPTYYAHHLYLNGDEIINLVIPDDVTTIGNYAFSGCSGLTSVTIPNSVTIIGGSAFKNCSGLTSVTIPNSVTSIGDNAFNYCSGLTSVTIPNSVTSIGEFAFKNCSGLTAVHITDLSAWCKIKFDDDIGGVIRDFTCNPTCYAHHLYLNDEEITNLVIPDDITSISNVAFFGCFGLTSVTIPNSVTSIGSSAFSDCSGLTSVTIPNSVTSIGSFAFKNCSGLTSVTIPNSVTSIGSGAFRDCSGLTSVTIPNSVTSIENYAFSGCNSITRIDCQAETPPAAYTNTFSSEIYTKTTLNVPEGSVEKYKVANIWKEFTNMTVGGVVPDEPKQCAAPVITYADGKLQCTCETEGAKFKYMLTDTDIKTEYTDMYNGSVNLSACYTIKAYAYADGYTNSEQVTATLYWINGSDVSTNINQTEMRGVMATCSGGIITVSGLTDGETVMFYNANGALLYTGAAQNGTVSYAPSASGVIIVKIGTTSIKVVLKSASNLNGNLNCSKELEHYAS